MNSIDEFLASFPIGSAEREYHSALAGAICQINFDSTNEEVGIGLLNFLCAQSFVRGSIDTRTHSIAGSRREDAMLVDAVFSKLARGIDWWVAQSLLRSTEWEGWWKCEFKKLDGVQVFD